MLWQAVCGVQVQELNFAGLERWMISKPRLPPHVSCVQYDLQVAGQIETTTSGLH